MSSSLTCVFATSDDAASPQAAWVEECLTTFGALFRGATAFPPGRGVWRDDPRGGKLVFDDTVMVPSYVDPAALTDFAIASLRKLLHRLGREAHQGEVGIVVSGDYYGITTYDVPEARR